MNGEVELKTPVKEIQNLFFLAPYPPSPVLGGDFTPGRWVPLEHRDSPAVPGEEGEGAAGIGSPSSVASVVALWPFRRKRKTHSWRRGALLWSLAFYKTSAGINP